MTRPTRPATTAAERARPARPLPRRLQGFTLIELLVVVLIIGIVLTFVSVSINTHNAAQRLDREADRLAALVRMAATDALLFGTEIGLDITPDGYRFVELTKSGWQVIGGDTPLHPRELGRGLKLVAVTSHNRERPQLIESGDDSEDDDAENVRRRPEALFLSSGMIVPFTLELHSEQTDEYYRLRGYPDGRIVLEQLGEGT